MTLRWIADSCRRERRDGKHAALGKLRDTVSAAINDWHQTQVIALDADLTAQRATLFGLVDRPDQTRVERMAAHLQKHTPEDIAVFYGSATDDERREMEAASALVGRVPMKGPNGLTWKPLLDAETCAEAQLARAAERSPTAVAQLRELEEVRRMQHTLVNVALQEIRR